jgi:glycosyltransferase involved in cell wall biosynthesis
MKILEVVEACGAGVGRHVRSLCKGLIDQDQQVTVAYAPHRTDEAFERFIVDTQDKIRFVPLQVGRKVSPVSDLKGIVRLLRLIQHSGPFDVVHGHSSKGGAIARIAGRWFGIPTVYTPHSLVISSPELSRAGTIAYTLIERALGRWATRRIIAVSADERDFIIKHKLLPENRIAMIENALDVEDFELFRKEENHNNTDRTEITFGSTMRFSPQKAPGHLVEAFGRLVELLPHVPVRLVIAGDGELYNKVKSQVEASGLDEKIDLIGWKTDVKVVLRNIDVFVVSSLYEAGASYSIIEAMAAKLPIVSTTVFGSQLLAQVSGNVLVPSGDPEALARGMRQIVTPAEGESIRQSLQSIGKANYEHAVERFSQSNNLRRTLQVYQELSSFGGREG